MKEGSRPTCFETEEVNHDSFHKLPFFEKMFSYALLMLFFTVIEFSRKMITNNDKKIMETFEFKGDSNDFVSELVQQVTSYITVRFIFYK